MVGSYCSHFTPSTAPGQLVQAVEGPHYHWRHVNYRPAVDTGTPLAGYHLSESTNPFAFLFNLSQLIKREIFCYSRD